MKLLLKCLRVVAGIFLIAWGLIGIIVPLVPGGMWMVLLGLAVLSIDIPFVKRWEVIINDYLKRKLPKFYPRFIAPMDRFKKRLVDKIRKLEKRPRK